MLIYVVINIILISLQCNEEAEWYRFSTWPRWGFLYHWQDWAGVRELSLWCMACVCCLCPHTCLPASMCCIQSLCQIWSINYHLHGFLLRPHFCMRVILMWECVSNIYISVLIVVDIVIELCDKAKQHWMVLWGHRSQRTESALLSLSDVFIIRIYIHDFCCCFCFPIIPFWYCFALYVSLCYWVWKAHSFNVIWIWKNIYFEYAQSSFICHIMIMFISLWNIYGA